VVHDTNLFESAYQELFSWCQARDFAGHDPFDALNSRVLRATPLSKSKNARFVWTQLIKRSPVDLRTVAVVPPERNSKGIALFALGLLANYRRLQTEESAEQASLILDDLLSLQLEGYSGAAWGYNFDWQSRNFFAPQGSATIVPTAFAARALLEAAQLFDQAKYLDPARSVCNFILHDLPRSAETSAEVCFSYSPQSDTQIFNASLLAAEILAGVYETTGEQELADWALRATRYVVKHQNANGSWTYGTKSSQAWVDNFHTAFILFSLYRIMKSLSFRGEFAQALERGYEYWKTNFFLADGWPKYYDDDPYPADAHAGASAIVTFLELSELDATATNQASNIALWTIRNLRDKEGFFYYQRRKFYTVRKPYMRWSQAWMLYALGRLLEAQEIRSGEDGS
jgi:hypothetical protein